MVRAGFSSSAKRGFTLIEMLVVVAIMSVVATATVSAIKGAQRQARAARCQANMHALYRAVAAFRADFNFYPPACGYECYDASSDKYFHYRGWVNWALSGSGEGNRSRRNDKGNKYSQKSGVREYSANSQAKNYRYAGTGCDKNKSADLGSGKITDSLAYRSIDEGAIFVYADKNPSIYCCDEFKRRYGSQSLRSYAMNMSFGSHRYRRDELCWDTPGNANRVALFVEMGNAKSKTPASDLGKAVGSSASGMEGGTETDSKEVYGDDSVWDWDGKWTRDRTKRNNKFSDADGSSGENIGVMHMKSGNCYGHVIFADGHLDSIALPKTDALKKEQRKDLGSGN